MFIEPKNVVPVNKGNFTFEQRNVHNCTEDADKLSF